jgi:hypothetical protein
MGDAERRSEGTEPASARSTEQTGTAPLNRDEASPQTDGVTVDRSPVGDAGAGVPNAGMSDSTSSLPAAAFGPVRMDLVYGAASYDIECESLTGRRIGGSPGSGPNLTASTENAASGNCSPWPSTNPRLNLTVMFTGFLPSEGLPTGQFDMADPTAVDHVRIELIASSQAELPIGAEQPLAVRYRSFDEQTEVPSSFVQLPGLSGAVVSRYRQGFEEQDLLEIMLTDVVLVPPPGAEVGDYPASVTIRSSVMYETALYNF